MAEVQQKKVTAEDLAGMFKDVIAPLAKQVSDISESIDTKIADAIKSTEKVPAITAHTNLLDDTKGGFKAMWHFARDVARADKSGGRDVSKELGSWEKVSREVTKAAGSGMEAGTDQYGGWLLPVEFQNNLLNAVEQKNVVMERCTKIPMGMPIVEIPYVNGFDLSSGLVYGGIQWTWVDELESVTETRPKIGKVQLKLNKCMGMCYTSDEILADSPQSMEALLKNGFENGLTYALMYAFLRGSGAGQPQGILNANCLVSVTQETDQPAGTIYFENIVNMYSRAFNPANCVWMANISCLPQMAAMNLAVGTGGVPVWMPAAGISSAPYPTLFGLPVIWTDFCSDVGTVGDIILADWSQYLVGQKSGKDVSNFDSSIHLKFDYAQTALRFQYRVDGNSWWKSSYTPPIATTKTRSPFVVVETR